ncbi:hypothetical protein GSY69_03710 [Brevibacterium sp. 5221]|uniref:Uncharacterized protein n=1 Tax=Brevibacterium rongguiense TaxID=2695267 RepID=A0A6N9H5I3_9MICO|nr:hypothetical protein [Brevibacterium rongguiense]MYM19101.1 hypothetical protein [Brevibacterium rongguiense]
MGAAILLAATLSDLGARLVCRGTDRAPRWVLLLACAVALCSGAAVALSVWGWPGLVAFVVTAIAWGAVAAASDAGARPRLHIGALCLLGAALAVAAAMAPWHQGATAPGGVAWDALIAWAAAAGFLTRPANEACRSVFALLHLRQPSGSQAIGPVRPPRRWTIRGFAERTVEVEEPAPAPGAPLLGGGRLIGTLERGLIVALVIAGMPPALAALAAAKGIVRFPEIAADRETGAKAEEFLVGSLMSWSIAGAVTAFLLLG